jgi:Thiolase, C-terminal domain
LVAEGGVAVAGCDELEDEFGERFGQHDRFAAEPKPYLVFVVVDVLEGEAGDRIGPLGVEMDEQPGDAVGGVDAVVVEQVTLGPINHVLPHERGPDPQNRPTLMPGDPQFFGFAPVEAATIALARAGIGWAGVSATELNEAFATQSLV